MFDGNQKSGGSTHRLREVGSWHPHYLQGVLAPSKRWLALGFLNHHSTVPLKMGESVNFKRWLPMAASSGPGYKSLKRDNGNGDPPSCKRLTQFFRRDGPQRLPAVIIFSHHPSMYDNIVVSSKSIHGTLGRFWEERIYDVSTFFRSFQLRISRCHFSTSSSTAPS